MKKVLFVFWLGLSVQYGLAQNMPAPNNQQMLDAFSRYWASAHQGAVNFAYMRMQQMPQKHSPELTRLERQKNPWQRKLTLQVKSCQPYLTEIAEEPAYLCRFQTLPAKLTPKYAFSSLFLFGNDKKVERKVLPFRYRNGKWTIGQPAMRFLNAQQMRPIVLATLDQSVDTPPHIFRLDEENAQAILKKGRNFYADPEYLPDMCQCVAANNLEEPLFHCVFDLLPNTAASSEQQLRLTIDWVYQEESGWQRKAYGFNKASTAF